MKIFASTILTTIISINCSFAQLEVNDTLLMAFDNNVFWNSSSELEQDIYADFGKYGSTNLADNDSTTCWAEGSENNGEQEYILFTIPVNTSEIKIKNGYQKSEDIYKANNRLRNVEFDLYASYQLMGYITESHNGFCLSEELTSSIAEVKDVLGYQNIALNFDWESINELMQQDNTFDKDRFVVKLKILDIYKGDKYDDACISDLQIVPNSYFEITKDEHGLLKISDFTVDTLFFDSEIIYQITEISENLEWIIFIEMPSDIENSRVETIYKLFSTRKKEFVEIKELNSMYGFIKKSGQYYLEGSDKDFNDLSICLDNL
jgi:hypothetical protein